MLHSDVFAKVKRIFFKTEKLSSELLAGEYKSAFKGTGLNFESIREYQYGDEIKNLDWKVTARMQKPFIRQYKEERQMKLLLVLDFSASSKFGTLEKTKKDLMIEVASVLAFLAVKNNDKVGLIIFTEELELYIKPKSGKAHVFRLIKELIAFKPKKMGTNIKFCLESLIKFSPKHSIIFYFSDFLDQQGNTHYHHELKLLKKTRDLNLVSVRDPKEFSLPNLGFLEILDPETKEKKIVNLNRKRLRDLIEHSQRDEQKKLELNFRKLGIKFLEISTDRDYVLSLESFLNGRPQHH